MLTGARLFVEQDGGAVMVEKLLRGTIEAPSIRAPGTPRLLDAIVLHGLARAPEQRFGTAREMAIALERLGGLATTSEIGDWVESLAAPKLAERAVRLKQVEMTSSTYRLQSDHAEADRVLPGLFDDEEDARDEPVLDMLIPIEEGASDSPTPDVQTAQIVTPQAIAVPIVAASRPAPRAVFVFAAYALLGAAIVLLAAALRWTHAAAAPAPPAVCPAEMTRVPGDAPASVAPFCLDVSPAASGADCRAAGKRSVTPAEREVAARFDRGYATGLRCATSL
jgi:serine/threonine-protein kinase